MYVQGFNTFALLDRYFDHYVCVSSFVAQICQDDLRVERHR